ncbi:MAG: hypothetical protein GKR99_09280 [Rhodobacteraceae bacterium]|nr:hypothetical protein [Paracoccaceae bacterium]
MNADTQQLRLGSVAVAGALIAYGGLMIAALARSGWNFEYPLDDVYIHLAMASEFARGGYGVNNGEVASAASSALYPLILTPFPDSQFQRFLPLAWNLFGLCLGAWLWGRALGWAGYRGLLGLFLAFLGPLVVGAHSTAFTGMEHALHGAASIAIIFGLARLLRDGTGVPMLLIGLFVAPLLRFEGLALVVLSIAILMSVGRWRLAVLGAALGLIPIAAFMGYLVSLGLDPLPNSVQAKLISDGEESISRLQRVIGTFRINIAKPGGLAILALVVAAMAMRLLDAGLRQSRIGWLALVIAGAGLGHLLFAQVGWMERYEHYAIAALGLGALILAASVGDRRGLATAIAVAALLPAAWNYVPRTISDYPWNIRAQYLQQAQMRRFAHQHLQRPIAVNDLGLAVWGNPDYVLDLYGLANDAARRARIFDPTPGWAGPMVDRHDVAVIMIYDSFIKAGISPDWQPLGKLVMLRAAGYVGDAEVSFYAATTEDVESAQKALNSWVSDLPPDACFVFANTDACAR